MTDEFDRELRGLARAARESDAARVSPAETEAALTEVTSGAQLARLRPVAAPETPRRRLLVGLAAAAVVVLLTAGIVWMSSRGEEQIRSAPGTTASTPATGVTTTTGPQGGVTVTTPVRAAPGPPVSAPSSPATAVDTTTTTTTTTAPPPPTTVGLDEALAGVVWEGSGIGRACHGATGNCTHVVFDPGGAPVSYDPTTRTLTHHMRSDGVLPTFVVPDALGAVWLLAAGPDAVVYLGVPSDDPEASDIVALGLAAGDAGREVARFEGALGLGDYDVVETPEGLASVGWYGQGTQPAEPPNILAEWVDRSGAPITSPRPLVQVDFYSHDVTIGPQSWDVGELPIEGILPAMPVIVATFDGGFLARWDGSQEDLRSVVVRGWADGSVEQWVVPGDWTEAGPALVEPTGLVLLPNGDWFARVEPFTHSTGWSGQLQADFDTWTATAPGLDEYLAANDPYWESDPVAFAAALGRFDVASLHSIEIVESTAELVTVVVTAERFLDDSVDGSRMTITLTPTDAGLRLVEIALTQACQPGRGQQDYQTSPCV